MTCQIKCWRSLDGWDLSADADKSDIPQADFITINLVGIQPDAMLRELPYHRTVCPMPWGRRPLEYCRVRTVPQEWERPGELAANSAIEVRCWPAPPWAEVSGHRAAMERPD